jgi:hypothetical protein
MALAAGVALVAVTARGCAADGAADRWFDDDPQTVVRTADLLADAMRNGTRPGDFSTGDARFDGEWALVSCQMTVLSLGGLLPTHPDRRERWWPAIHSCAEWLATPEARAFGAAAWGIDALEDPDPRHVHAYLGWTAVALATAGGLGDLDAERAGARLTGRLARAVDGRPLRELETYPGEVYPPDLAVVAAALATAGGHDDVLAPFVARFRGEAIDPATGLLHQTLHGDERGAVRGSGTALAAHFLHAADPALALGLARAAREHLRDHLGPFGGVREVPPGAAPAADIDSGPVVFGLSVSASGFALASARRLDDRVWHRELFRSAHSAGAAVDGWFWTGGCMGNAVLLTMLTAQR